VVTEHLLSSRGSPYPLGPTLQAEGVNFALFSEHATAVELCLFHADDEQKEFARVLLQERSDGVWHGLVPGLKAGQLYGLRVHGPNRPDLGHRFDATKLLLDPYARAIIGGFRWRDDSPAHKAHVSSGDEHPDAHDHAAGVPKCIVVDPAFDWGDDRRPTVPLADSVIYEAHVKGFSKLAPLPEGLRGTYAALGSDWAIAYLQKLGVTAVELLPVQQFVNEQFLERRGLSNYWGYSPIGYFAPHAAYAASPQPGAQVAEFKGMVKRLHAAGLEVILDVVYNHTGEGNGDGPTLCFRGIDNATYYLAPPGDPEAYVDHTGCGNTVQVAHPRVLQLIMDSLRYWVLEMHVDGFRFDLATTLGREGNGFDAGAAFFDIVRQDPVLSQVKLIAEPWDLGPGSYQAGNFPTPFAEWNGRYRDGVRTYWKGDRGSLGDLAHRITGSSDMFHSAHRTPAASINFITAHDGFTLTDLVSYDAKHNEANGEHNQDGESHNRSWNCGIEGDTDDPEITALRRRQRRNFLATLLLSQGVPMLCAGDEYGRSQNGNNNAYCHDSELSWLRWDRGEEEQRFEDFVTRLIAFRRAHSALRRRRFFAERTAHPTADKEILWLRTDGCEMGESDWASPHMRCVAVILSSAPIGGVNAPANVAQDDTFMMLFNAHHEPVDFQLAGREDVRWLLLLDTREETGFVATPAEHPAGERFVSESRSLCLFRLSAGSSEDARTESWRTAVDA